MIPNLLRIIIKFIKKAYKQNTCWHDMSVCTLHSSPEERFHNRCFLEKCTKCGFEPFL